MTTTVSLKKILDRKVFEMCSPLPTATAAGRFISSGRLHRQVQYYLESATVAWMYLPEEDAPIELPSPALGGTFAAGACGVCTPDGESGTATAGTTLTITTNLTLARDLRGYRVWISAGPNAGLWRTIAKNTIGANAVITVDSAYPVAITAASAYILYTGSWWVFNAHTAAPVANQFKRYSYATNTWTALANLPAVGAAWGTDGRLIATPSIVNNTVNTFATGTATGGTTTTLVKTGSGWTASQWVNAFQVRMLTGAGAGQIKAITASTTDTLTFAAGTAPDATTTYQIEGADDFLYLMGNNAVALYRYSKSAGTWTTLAPGVARAAAPGLGLSGHWVWGVADAAWNTETAVLNGRRIYSFRGAGGAVLDHYDIPSNAWTNALTYSPATATFTTGTKWSIVDGRYIVCQKDATGRFYRYDPLLQQMDPLTYDPYTQGAAVVGDTMFDVVYIDGVTTLTWIYYGLNTSTALRRVLLI